MGMASRIAVMEAGKLRQIGPPSEVYERPNCRFVAGFLGAVNLLAGRVAKKSASRLTLDSAEAGGTIMVTAADEIALGSDVTVALRPEKLSLSREAGAVAAVNRIPAVLQDIRFLGEISVCRLALVSGSELRVNLLNAAAGPPPFAVGEALWVSWPESAGILLQG
jgi:putrescine transport system ATP-binding protein